MAMWFQMEVSLPWDPRTLGLAADLGITARDALGMVARLRGFAIQYAEDGNFERFSHNQIASALNEPPDESVRVVNALLQNHFLEESPGLRMAGWWELSGRFLRTKYKDTPKKWQKIRDAYEEGNTDQCPKDSVTGCVADTATRETNKQTNKQTNKNTPRGRSAARQSRLDLPLSKQAQEVVDAWNELPEPFPKVRVMTPERHAALEERLAEEGFRNGWKAVIAALPHSRFHRGEGNQRWKANFDWFVKPDKVELFLEKNATKASSDERFTNVL